MKRAITVTLILVVLIPLVPSAAIAQGLPESDVSIIIHEKVKPSGGEKYESIAKEFIRLLAKHKYSSSWRWAVAEDGTYISAITMPDYGTLDKLWVQYNGIFQKEGDKAKGLIERIGSISNGQSIWFSESRPDLSYVPDNPRVKQNEAGFVRCYRLYLAMGLEAKLDSLMKEYVELFKKHKISTGFNISVNISGDNLPCYVSCFPFLNASDYYSESENMNKIMGKTLTDINRRANSLLRQVDIKNYTPKHDISYIPNKQ